jgi:hypothetical protein
MRSPRLLTCIAALTLTGCGDRSTQSLSPTAPPKAALQRISGEPSGPIVLHTYMDDATDQSGHGHNGVVYGSPQYHPSILGRAMVLDGRDDFVMIPPDAELEPEAVSVEVYFRPQAALRDGNGFVPLVVKLPNWGNFWNRVDGYDLWYQDSGGGGRIGFGIGAYEGRSRANTWFMTTLLPNRTHHVVGTYGGEALRLYLNGDLVATLPWTEPIAYLGGPIWIGGPIYHSYFGSGTHLASGAVDEFALYGYVMTPEEVRLRAMRAERNPGVGRLSQAQ